MLHYTRDVFDFNDVQFKWEVKGEVQAFLNEGINTLKEGNVEVSIGQLTEAIDRDQTFWVPRYYRAICYKLTNRKEEALHDLLEADAVNRNHYETNLELGKVYMLHERGSKAEQYLNNARMLNPTAAEPYYFLGIIQLVYGNFDDARKNFQKCNDLQPKFPDSKIQLALMAARKEDDLYAAIPYLDKAIEGDSMQADAREARLLIRVNAQIDLRKALEDVNFLLKYNQFHLRWRAARAYLLLLYTDYDAAFADLKRVFDATSRNENHFMWSSMQTEESIEVQNAGRYISSKIYGLPDKDASTIRKAFCLIVAKKYEAALATLSNGSRSEGHVTFLYLKGLANDLWGYLGDAQPYYSRALARDNDIFDLHKRVGISHSKNQRYNAAIKEFNEMERLIPDAIITYKLRGLARIQIQEYRLALTDLLRADSTDSECIWGIGICYQNLGSMLPATRELIRGGNYIHIDFDKLNKTADSLIWKQDTVKLVELARSFPPDLLARVSEFQVLHAARLKLKLMLVEKKWEEIDLGWKEFEPTKYIRDDKRLGSCLFTIRGAWLINKKELKEAMVILNKAVDYDKYNSHAFFQRATLHSMLNDPTNAKLDLAAASKLGDSRATNLLHLATNK